MPDVPTLIDLTARSVEVEFPIVILLTIRCPIALIVKSNGKSRGS